MRMWSCDGSGFASARWADTQEGEGDLKTGWGKGGCQLKKGEEGRRRGREGREETDWWRPSE